METEELKGKEVWAAFKRDFIYTHGIHLLGLGQTNTGKTQKSYQIQKYLLEAGELGIHIDSGKSGEILPLMKICAELKKPVKIIIPVGCHLESSYPGCEITVKQVKTPRKAWEAIERDTLNIITARQFFYEVQGYGRYISTFIKYLLQFAFDQRLPIDPKKEGLYVNIDEAANVMPGHDLQKMDRAMVNSAIKIAYAAKGLRSMGIRLLAWDQAWGDLFPPARRQFPFLLLCRSPGIPKTMEVLGDYRFLWRTLKVNQAIMVFPQFAWHGVWGFPLFTPDQTATLTYGGKAESPFNRVKEIDEEIEADPLQAMISKQLTEMMSKAPAGGIHESL